MDTWNNMSGDTDDASASFPDPWFGDHDIEYWVWNGARLVPASASEQEALQAMERAQSARRLAQWTQRQASPRIRILAAMRRGMRKMITSLWRIGRHSAWPTVAPPGTHHPIISAHHRGGER